MSALDRMQLGAAATLRRTADRLSRRARRGEVVRKVSLGDLELEGWTSVAPVFFLSTGRCGTKLVSEVFEAAGGATVAHAPRPELVRASRLAYERIAAEPEVFAETFKSAREELVWQAARHGEVFVETNNRITFFAPVIRRAFPNARFVHVVRHPGDFVRSGIRRHWYEGGHAHDIGRIHGDAAGWEDLDPIAKIGWLWNATNTFVEEFRSTVPADAFHFVTAEDMFSSADALAALLAFCGLPALGRDRLAAFAASPVNAQSSGDFPAFAEWTPQQRALLREQAPLAASYGYEL